MPTTRHAKKRQDVDSIDTVVESQPKQTSDFGWYNPIEAGDSGYRSPNRSYQRKTYPWLPGGVFDKGY